MVPSLPGPQGRPRAYLCAVPSREEVERARAWAGPRMEAPGWSRIGILLSTPEVGQSSRVLRQLHARGATVGAPAELGALKEWPGPLLVYEPTLATLAAGEAITTATRLIVLTADAAVLQPWVDAFDPEHLGGQHLPAAAVVLPVALVRRTMVYFTHHLQSGALVGGRLWELLLRRLEELYHHEQHFSPEDLLALAWQLHWPPDATWELYRWAHEHLPCATLHPRP